MNEKRYRQLQKNKHEIIEIEEGSIAEELDIEVGDYLIAIDGKEIIDVFDYRMLVLQDYLEVLIEKKDGEPWLLEIDKEVGEELGFEFASGLMDTERSCSNKCIFCFVDQLPKGMRETLYFKDDDTRLSFLTGNYVTLTNMDDEEIDRMIEHKLSPVNLSVHATDPDVREFMVKNPKTRLLMDRMKKLDDAGIIMNYQVVLCKDVNDKEVLERTIRELSAFENGKSLSIVPVGLSNHREGLEPLEPLTKEDAEKTLDIIEAAQKYCLEEKGSKFVFPSDEFFLLAERDLPDVDYYEEFHQLANGVGMTSLFKHEFLEAFAENKELLRDIKTTVVTGKLAYPKIKELTDIINEELEDEIVDVVKVTNEFFGEQITVSGLLTGSDLKQTITKPKGERVFLPVDLLRAETNVLLDDITTDDLADFWKKDVHAVNTDGKSFFRAFCEEF